MRIIKWLSESSGLRINETLHVTRENVSTMFFVIKGANLLEIENAHHSPFT